MFDPFRIMSGAVAINVGGASIFTAILVSNDRGQPTDVLERTINTNSFQPFYSMQGNVVCRLIANITCGYPSVVGERNQQCALQYELPSAMACGLAKWWLERLHMVMLACEQLILLGKYIWCE
ncbi:hypothetical protein [Aeromonas finlandensis]|uniref:hypothetical protein n=1 Tax=Aeromonas finlandensis TaxID=1543375 RepID=UPI0012DFF456|nr:hypothetical protein [Aeromonas finlandensis]